MPASIYGLANAEEKEILALAEITADGNGSGVDISAYEGVGRFVLQAKNTAGTTPGLACKLQHSEDDGDDDAYADVSGGAFTAATDAAYTPSAISLNVNNLKKYVRVVKDISGTSTPKYFASCVLVALRKYPDPS